MQVSMTMLSPVSWKKKHVQNSRKSTPKCKTYVVGGKDPCDCSRGEQEGCDGGQLTGVAVAEVSDNLKLAEKSEQNANENAAFKYFL